MQDDRRLHVAAEQPEDPLLGAVEHPLQLVPVPAGGQSGLETQPPLEKELRPPGAIVGRSVFPAIVQWLVGLRCRADKVIAGETAGFAPEAV